MTRASAANRPAAWSRWTQVEQARAHRVDRPRHVLVLEDRLAVVHGPERLEDRARRDSASCVDRAVDVAPPGCRAPRRAGPARARRVGCAAPATTGFRLPKAIECRSTRTLPSVPRCVGQRVEDRRHALRAERVEVQAEEPAPARPDRVELAVDAVHRAAAVAVHDAHVHALGGELLGRGQAEPARAPEDQRPLLRCESSHRCPVFVRRTSQPRFHRARAAAFSRRRQQSPSGSLPQKVGFERESTSTVRGGRRAPGQLARPIRETRRREMSCEENRSRWWSPCRSSPC